MDKFLITARKLEPVKYTFYTVVTGLRFVGGLAVELLAASGHQILLLMLFRRHVFSGNVCVF